MAASAGDDTAVVITVAESPASCIPTRVARHGAVAESVLRTASCKRGDLAALPNVGNSCWLNAALQLIMLIPGASTALQEHAVEHDVANRTSARDMSLDCVACAVHRAIACARDQHRHGGDKRRVQRALNRLCDVICRTQPDFKPGMQNDASECLVWLLGCVIRPKDCTSTLWEFNAKRDCTCNGITTSSTPLELAHFNVPIMHKWERFDLVQELSASFFDFHTGKARCTTCNVVSDLRLSGSRCELSDFVLISIGRFDFQEQSSLGRKCHAKVTVPAAVTMDGVRVVGDVRDLVPFDETADAAFRFPTSVWQSWSIWDPHLSGDTLSRTLQLKKAGSRQVMAVRRSAYEGLATTHWPVADET